MATMFHILFSKSLIFDVMGSYKEEHGKTRVGMFLKSMGSIGDDVLRLAGDLTGVEALNAIGDAIGKNEQIKNEHKKLAYDLLVQDIEDRKSARESNVKIQESANASWVAKNLPYIFDCFILVVWGAMTFYIVFRWLGLITDQVGTVDMTGILGIYSGITALATMVIQFHRGSSAGSQSKNSLFGSMVKK